jgi:nucleoid DNA-binding protein
MSNLTRLGIATELAKAKTLPLTEAECYVNFTVTAIVEALASGQDVELRGFGSLRLVQRAARPGRNPKTGEPVSIPAKRAVKFKPALELRKRLNA